MIFRIVLNLIEKLPASIPVNYQYPLSSALYKIISKGDEGYAQFLHEKGYGKGFKLFTFSQINCAFSINGDRMLLQGSEINFRVAFHLPPAAENFIKGLFQSEKFEIADSRSKATFAIKTVESLPNPLLAYPDREIVSVQMKPLSPVVAGVHNEKGNYNFLDPGDSRFVESLLYNWRSKIAACYDKNIADAALLLAEVLAMKQPFKSRLITIKDGTEQETKIRGWMNFGLKVTAEKRFAELLQNAGCGLYNAMGCGCVEIMTFNKRD